MFKLFAKNLKWYHYLIIAIVAVMVLGNVELDIMTTEKMQTILNYLSVTAANKMDTSHIWREGGIMIAYGIGTVILTIVIGFLASRIGTDFSKSVRGNLYSKVSNMSQTQMGNFSVPSLMTRTSNDVSQVQMVLIFGIRLIFNAPFMAIRAIMKISNISISLSLVVVAAIVMIIILIALTFGIAYPKIKIMQRQNDQLNLVTRESLTGVRVIRAHGSEVQEQKRFAKTNRELTKTHYFVNVVMSFMEPGINLIMLGVNVGIYWLGAQLMMNGEAILYPDLAAFTNYSMSIIMSFMFLIMMLVIAPRAAVSAKRINEVMDSTDPIKYPEMPLLSTPETRKTDSFNLENRNKLSGAVMIEDLAEDLEVRFEDVSFKYQGAEGYILENLSFEVKKGETLAIIGATGSGKSSLINLIPRFHDVFEGSIKIAGHDVREFQKNELNSLIGYVPQRGYLFSGSVDYNVKLGISEDEHTLEEPGNELTFEEREELFSLEEKNSYPTDVDNISEAMRISNSIEFVQNLPEQLDYRITQGGTNVSGGQRQRLCIARAIAKNPKIYIFDDSFSALDYKTDKDVRAALKEKTTEAINIIVAQRVGTIMDADQILVMDKGKIIGKGTHRKLLKDCPEYYEIAQSQLTEEELA